jgi:uncharacterized protein (TIGR02597 family)
MSALPDNLLKILLTDCRPCLRSQAEMKISQIALLAAMFSMPLALAQETAVTSPVGVVTVPTRAGSKSAISIPLEEPAIAFGTVSAVTSNSITDAEANFDPLANSHFVRVLSGNAEGRILRILSNTANTLAVETGINQWALPVDASAGNTVNVAPGDTYEIVPMWTLEDIFGGTAEDCVLLTGSNPTRADQVLVYADGSQAGFFHNGTHFRNAINPGDTTNYNTWGIMPTSGLWLNRRANGFDAELVFIGNVPVSAPRFHTPGGTAFGQGIPFPAEATIASLGLGSIPSWNKNNNPSRADQITIYKPDGTFTTFFQNNAGAWRNAISPSDTQDYLEVKIPGGSGLWIRRRGSESGPQVNFASTLPYNLSN